MEKCVEQMSSVLAWADLAKYNRWDGLNHRHFSVITAEKTNIRKPAYLFLLRTLFWFSLHGHPLFFLIKDTNPVMGPHPHDLLSQLDYSKGSTSKYHYTGLNSFNI